MKNIANNQNQNQNQAGEVEVHSDFRRLETALDGAVVLDSNNEKPARKLIHRCWVAAHDGEGINGSHPATRMNHLGISAEFSQVKPCGEMNLGK